jgi:hypothetical protein
MQLEHDLQADAVYITLRDEAYSWGQDFDHRRRVDFGADNTPIGIELLLVSKGVDVTDLPEREAIIGLLHDRGIAINAPRPSADNRGTAA